MVSIQGRKTRPMERSYSLELRGVIGGGLQQKIVQSLHEIRLYIADARIQSKRPNTDCTHIHFTRSRRKDDKEEEANADCTDPTQNFGGVLKISVMMACPRLTTAPTNTTGGYTRRKTNASHDLLQLQST